MNKVRFAVIGAGHIGKRHAQVIQNIKHGELVAIADTDPLAAAVIQPLFQVPVYPSLENLLEEENNIDVINICTPNGEHASQAIKVLQAGYHAVCEKPMALTKVDCNKIIQVAHKAGKTVFPVMQNRYSPPAIWLKGLIADGLMGKINMVVVNCLWNRDNRYYSSSTWRGSKRLDGGTLFTQFSHFIDTLFWIFGDVTNIQGRINNFNHSNLIDFEDSGLLTFDFLSGGFCSFNYTTSVWDKNYISSITVVGELGTVKIGGQYMNEVDYCHIKNYSMPQLEACLPANDYGHYKGSAANHEFMINNVIDHLLYDKKITTTAYEGMKVVEIIEKMYAKCSPARSAEILYPLNQEKS